MHQREIGWEETGALSTLRGLRGAPEVPPLCRETQSLGQQMLNAPVGINELTKKIFTKCLLYMTTFPPCLLYPILVDTKKRWS